MKADREKVEIFWKVYGRKRTAQLISSRVRHHALEIVFVDDGCHGALAVVFTTADDAARAVHQNVSVSADHDRRQDDPEADHCADRKLSAHVEQHAASRDIGRLSKMFAGITGADGNGKS